MTIQEAADRIGSTYRAVQALLLRYPHLCTTTGEGRRRLVDVPESSIQELRKRTGNRGRPSDEAT